METKDAIYRFAASLCLADNIGDVWDDLFQLAKVLGVKLPDWDEDYLQILMDNGATHTIWDSILD